MADSNNGTLEINFREMVETLFFETIVGDPSLASDAKIDDGSFLTQADRRGREQIYLILSFLGASDVVQIMLEDLASGTPLVGILQKYQPLSLPLPLVYFMVRWQTMLEIYLSSRAGIVSSTLAQS